MAFLTLRLSLSESRLPPALVTVALRLLAIFTAFLPSLSLRATFLPTLATAVALHRTEQRTRRRRPRLRAVDRLLLAAVTRTFSVPVRVDGLCCGPGRGVGVGVGVADG